MSYDSFKTACNYMQQFPDFESSGGMSLKNIELAEGIIGFHFSPQCIEFYQKYDYVSFGGIEIFGIVDPFNSSVLEGNLVAYIINDRKTIGLPILWVPVFNYGDGSLAYFDYSRLNDCMEPCIIRAYYDGKQYIRLDDVASDFGDFLLELIADYANT